MATYPLSVKMVSRAGVRRATGELAYCYAALVVALSALGIPADPARAQGQGEGTPAVPAQFTTDKRSLQNRIQFPISEGDVSVEVACEAWLNERGAFRMNFCFGATEVDREFHSAISLASRRARIAPAVVDGKPQPVWFQYRVRFTRQGTSEQVTAYPNHALQADELGPAYSSPQRIEFGYANLRRCDDQTRLAIQATVSEQGEPMDVKIEPGGTAAEVCRSEVLAWMRSARFVAARANDAPVRARYRYLIFCAASVAGTRDCRTWL